MQTYENLNGDSGVRCFEIGSDYILVQFVGTFRTYRYSYSKAGEIHVEQMKLLAQRGQGLNSYINKNARNLFD